MTRDALCCICFVLCACSAKPAPATAKPAAAVPHPSATAEPKLEALLAQRGVSGAIVVLEGEASSARCSDLARCNEPLVPASTFKIPNSIIGLETGVIPDAEFVIPWDGKTRAIDAWNRDHSLRTALRDSAFPYYQELARRVGRERMQTWLARLEYGNQRIGDAIDTFWLEGPLAITPLEQVEFLRKLARARLPITPRTHAIVLDITRRGDLDGKPFHGKTGWADHDGPNETGWFIGWIEQGAASRYVAVAIVRPPDNVDLLPLRQALAEEALRLP